MQVGISSIGIAVPRHKQAQSQAAETVADMLGLMPSKRRLLKSLYKATGIQYRHSVLQDYLKSRGEFTFFPNDFDEPFPSTAKRMVLYRENALDLACAAIADCLSPSQNFNLQEITHVITVSCTGMYAPGLDIEIIQALGLSPTTKRIAINFMGCYGAFNAMEAAHDICKANPTAKVLVVCVELCTIHFQQKASMEDMVANAIFADGAAAVLIEDCSLKPKSLNFAGFYCDLLPQSKQEMAWMIGDDGFDITLSAYVPELIKNGILNFTERFLKNQNLNFSDLDLYAIHPGGIKILQACETALSLNHDQNRYAYEVLAQYGNMSSATILFVLKALWQDKGAEGHHQSIMSCAFGPGLTVQAMILRIKHV